MTNKIIILESDDVVSFSKETFKVSRLKELIVEQITRKWRTEIYQPEKKIYESTVYNLFQRISLNSEQIEMDYFERNSMKTCQILKTVGQGWQKGKIKINLSISIRDSKSNVYLEFYPDEPAELESPLDDIRKMIQAQAI